MQAKLQADALNEKPAPDKRQTAIPTAPLLPKLQVPTQSGTETGQLTGIHIRQLKAASANQPTTTMAPYRPASSLHPTGIRIPPSKDTLQSALQSEDMELAVQEVQKGANPNTSTITGLTALHITMKQGKINHAQVLLEAGAVLNQPDCNGNTPAHTAAASFHLHAYHWVITKGAKQTKNHLGKTPWMVRLLM